MFYKVIKNGNIVDVLEQLTFLKYQNRNKIVVLCEKAEAQAVLGSDQRTVWFEESLCKNPPAGYEAVKLVRIDEHEYKQLKMLNGKTPEEIIDAFVLTLINEGVI